MNNIEKLLYNYIKENFENNNKYIYCVDNNEIVSSDILINDFMNKYEDEIEEENLYVYFEMYINCITDRNSNCIIIIKE